MLFHREHGKFEKTDASKKAAESAAGDALTYTEDQPEAATPETTDFYKGPGEFAASAWSDPKTSTPTAPAGSGSSASQLPGKQPGKQNAGHFAASAYTEDPLPGRRPAPQTAAAGQYSYQDDYDYFNREHQPDDDDDDDDDGGRRRFFTVRNVAIILTTLFVILAIGAGCIFAYLYFVVQPYADYDTIMPNVYCAGVNLEGMTQAEAETAIEEALASPSYSVTVNLPDCSYTFCPEQEGVAVNAASAAKRAFDYMRSDTSAFGMYKAYKTASNTEYQISAESALVYSREDIEALAAQIAEDTYVPATDSSVSSDTSALTVSLTLGTPGRCIDADTITAAVCSAFDSLNFTDIELKYTEIPLDQEAIKALCDGASATCNIPVTPAVVTADTENHCINVTAGSPGYTADTDALYQAAIAAISDGTYGTVTVSMTEADPDAPDIQEAYDAIACDPVEPYYEDGDIVESSPGYSLDLDTAKAQAAVLSFGQSTTFTFDETQPSMTSDEMRELLFRDTLASYDTPHTALAGRTTNLTLACNAIDGTVLNPGEEFSFNGVVGERTAAKGYQEATVYVNGESVGELGGGICQVASTMYYAALLADFEITDREEHMYFVTYVPGGLDATVYYGVQDFCFKNNTDYPVKIDASVYGGYVHITYEGTNITGNYVELSSDCIGTENYSTTYQYSSAYYYGYRAQTTSPYTGYTYEAWQYVYGPDGTLLETNYLGVSKYNKRDAVITIGVG